ncbi:MAG: NUDIX hydrolase [Pseudoruegeria sp.]
MRRAKKRDVRTQFAALCYRVKNGKVEVLMVTSRGTGRWIIPKGWPMDGQTPAAAAATEAFEEAGVDGRVKDMCLGIYSYQKDIGDDALPCVVAVFPVKVKRLHDNFPEAKERKRKWFSRKKAAARVKESELAQIIQNFDPRRL